MTFHLQSGTSQVMSNSTASTEWETNATLATSTVKTITHCEVIGEDPVSSKKTIDSTLLTSNSSLIQDLNFKLSEVTKTTHKGSQPRLPRFHFVISIAIIFFPVPIKSWYILQLDLALLCISKILAFCANPAAEIAARGQPRGRPVLRYGIQNLDKFLLLGHF